MWSRPRSPWGNSGLLVSPHSAPPNATRVFGTPANSSRNRPRRRTLGAHMATAREDIVAAARGDQPMDLVVRGAHLVNVFTAEIYPADIVIKDDRFAAVVRATR